MHHADYIAYQDLLTAIPPRPKLFKAHIAAMGKPTFAFTVFAIDMAHASRECEAMLLPGDSLTVEALQS